MNCQEKLTLIEKENPDISISRQTELLGISRSSVYHQSTDNPKDIPIMNAVDEKNGSGSNLSQKEAQYQQGNEAHKKYPYLLKDLIIKRPNHVWGTHITYIRLKCGFIYLTVIIDWFSRYILSWKLSVTMETGFCIDALNLALNINLPEFHNSDQGVQFTDKDYVGILEENNISISMDGRGRCMDNIFTERFWRSLKYENIYLNDYTDFIDAYQGIKKYIEFCNKRRKHQSLDYKTTAQIYLGK